MQIRTSWYWVGKADILLTAIIAGTWLILFPGCDRSIENPVPTPAAPTTTPVPIKAPVLSKKENRRLNDIPQLINFHLLLASFTQNSLLKYFLQSMIDFSTSYVQQYAPIHLSPFEHLSQHKDIFNSIKTKNPEHCREVLKLHLYGVAENLEIAMHRSKNEQFDIGSGDLGFLSSPEEIKKISV